MVYVAEMIGRSVTHHVEQAPSIAFAAVSSVNPAKVEECDAIVAADLVARMVELGAALEAGAKEPEGAAKE